MAFSRTTGDLADPSDPVALVFGADLDLGWLGGMSSEGLC